MSHTGARASAGHEIQACLCGLLSLQELQLKGQWGIAPRQKFTIFFFLDNKTTMYHTLVLFVQEGGITRTQVTIPAWAQISS